MLAPTATNSASAGFVDNSKQSDLGKKDIFLKNLETDLGRKLGTKVEIIPLQKGGKVVITYYSDDDLERIRGMMGKKIG